MAILHALSVPASVLAVAGLAACGRGEPDTPGELTVERDTIADTVVVRTRSGSTWGSDAELVPEVTIGALDGADEYLFGQVRSLAVGADGTINVVDAQVPDLRAFTPEGEYIATLARPGEGPGELKGPDGGLTVLSDGRILVRDPGNARIQVFDTRGEALTTWPIRGNFNTSRPFLRDRDDNVHVTILLDPEADVRDWQTGLVQIGPDGLPGDTLIPPDAGYAAPELEARYTSGDNNSVSRTGVPFSPSEEWTLHPDGYFIHGISTEYRFTLLRPGSPLRVERVDDPVPVRGGEKREEELRVTRSMRSTEPGWQWDGSGIPDRKPPFRSLSAGKDGRIWVMVSQPAVEVEDPGYDPSDPEALPDAWLEPVAYDVFEDDGTFLGRVHAPLGFAPYPAPVFDGDYVWAVTRDDLGVNRVARFRIVRESGTD